MLICFVLMAALLERYSFHQFMLLAALYVTAAISVRRRR